jgi:hypothetical protein
MAARALEWLQSGGHLALCWSDPPWAGDTGWQRTLSTRLDRWRHTLKAEERLPTDWDAARAATPDDVVLTAAGFVPLGRHQWNVEHLWTVAALAGFVYSTSFLARPVFGDRAADFEADRASSLSPYGDLLDTVNYAYDLFQKPDPVEYTNA